MLKSKDSDKALINNLQNFKGGTFFKQAVIHILVKMADDSAVAELQRDFKRIDADGSGTID
jgi:hypothetical protein